VSTTNLPSGFIFANAAPAGPSTHVVQIGPGVRRKRQLWAAFERGLPLPDYFGRNWDALDECLRDLSWLAEPRRIRIEHDDVPFAPGGRNRSDYLALLADLIAGGAPLQVVFPPACREDVARALAVARG
jgi:hypothetical protein